MGIVLQGVSLLLMGGLAVMGPASVVFWIVLAGLAVCAVADLYLWLLLRRKQAELAAAETRKYQLRRLHDAVYGVMIGAESLYRGDFSAYSRMFIELPFRPPKANLSSRPGGAYLRAFYQGEWGGLPERYREILEYARQNRLELVDFAYETGINETTIDRIEDYIVQIEIPIRPML